MDGWKQAGGLTTSKIWAHKQGTAGVEMGEGSVGFSLGPQKQPRRAKQQGKQGAQQPGREKEQAGLQNDRRRSK